MKMVLRAIGLVATIAVLLVIFGYEHRASPPQSGRFIKLDSQGKPMSPWQGPWACILDRHTGLMWENKTDNESIHDALWTYSWFQNGIGVQNAGDCYFEPDRCDTADLIRRVNQQQTCGRNNWRLPHSDELLTIVHQQPKTGEAKIAGDFFSHTKRGDYWTADSGISMQGVYAHLKQGARAIDFIEGKPRDIPYRNAAFVRLVSSPVEK